jgi:hypothetical protein
MGFPNLKPPSHIHYTSISTCEILSHESGVVSPYIKVDSDEIIRLHNQDNGSSAGMDCLVTTILRLSLYHSCRLPYHIAWTRFARRLITISKSFSTSTSTTNVLAKQQSAAKKIPHALGLPLTRHCIICGILYHYGFGEEFRGVSPESTRALNARSIMSDHIPLMSSESEFLHYCILAPSSRC